MKYVGDVRSALTSLTNDERPSRPIYLEAPMTITTMSDFSSDIVLGEKYRDPQTGVEGVATSLHFYQFACERVTIEVLTKDGQILEHSFDAPRLEHALTAAVARVTNAGGPGDGVRGSTASRTQPLR